MALEICDDFGCLVYVGLFIRECLCELHARFHVSPRFSCSFLLFFIRNTLTVELLLLTRTKPTSNVQCNAKHSKIGKQITIITALGSYIIHCVTFQVCQRAHYHTLTSNRFSTNLFRYMSAFVVRLQWIWLPF